MERGRDPPETCPINKVHKGVRRRGRREVLIGTSPAYLYGADKVVRVRQVRRGGPSGESQLHLPSRSGRLPSLRRRETGDSSCLSYIYGRLILN